MSPITQPALFDSWDVSVFPSSETITKAAETLASNRSNGERGAVFTRIEIVEFILDLVGYFETKPLYKQTILEPSFGRGDFLLPIVDRLLHSWKKYSGNFLKAYEELSPAIRAVELHRESFHGARQSIVDRLLSEGFPASVSSDLASQWLMQGDFLLEPLNPVFDFVVGNPPYVRQELIPAPLLAEYRQRYRTMYDRADLYIPFIERSLSLLDDRGACCFICADRWMKNRYGGPLREYIAENCHLKAYIDMVGTEAFHSDVIAYPAITVIEKGRVGKTRVAHKPMLNRTELSSIASHMNARTVPSNSLVREIKGVVKGSEPWLLGPSVELSLIRRLEGEFPTLEQAGCKVGIGVATGADKAYIGDFDSLDVEPDRKLPMVATRDIKSGEVVWRGQGVINPFADDGSLVNLQDYPKLAKYFDERRDIVKRRHCAKKSPSKWYRTLDRIWPDLVRKPKLLIPDIKGDAHVVFEPGNLYPHHNLYYVVSQTWPLRALQAVLLSNVARLFVATYSTKMRGGYLRFQAQYLRRIRIPYWKEVSEGLRQELVAAARDRNLEACNQAVFKLYRLSQEEQSILGQNEA